jgi:hypothetical protein
MKKLVVAGIMAGLLLGAYARGASVNLAWDPPTNCVDGTPLADLGGYKLYYGSTSRTAKAYSTTNDVGNVTTTTVSNLTGLVYIAVSAYNESLDESDYSDELIWAAFAPNAPAISSYKYAVKTGKLTLTGAQPTKNTDGSSCVGKIGGYIAGYGQVSRTVAPYTNFSESATPSRTLSIPTNSGTWYLSMATTNIWGSIGPWSAELSFGTSLPGKPKLLSVPPMDLR